MSERGFVDIIFLNTFRGTVVPWQNILLGKVTHFFLKCKTANTYFVLEWVMIVSMLIESVPMW